MEKKILDQALVQVEEHGFDGDDSRAVVLGAEGWHPGVIGIVASRIVERLHRPTVMVAMNNGIGQGSCRSIAGFHLAEALSACGEHLVTHGGHEMAAGLKLETAHFEDFRAAFCEYARGKVSDEMLLPTIELETLAELRQINMALVQDLKKLGPFGNGNRKPLLCCRDVEVATPPRRVGKTGDHLQLQVKQGNAQMKCIGFNMGTLFDELTVGRKLDLAVEPTINEFNGYVNVELELKDLRVGDPR
jgi:single-stranded-DNA-specific exonuclease